MSCGWIMVRRAGDVSHLVPTPPDPDAIPDPVTALCGDRLPLEDPAVELVDTPDGHPCGACREALIAAAQRAP